MTVNVFGSQGKPWMSIRPEESHILLLLNVVYINFDSEYLIVNVKTTNVIAAILDQHQNS